MRENRAFFQHFFALYWPIVLQNVVLLSVNLMDSIMLGAYSENALSGAAAVNQIQFILQMVVGGVGTGLVVLGSQYWGERRIAPIRSLACIALLIGTAVSLIFLFVCGLFPAPMLRLFTRDEDIVREGARYLSIMYLTYPIFAVTLILQNLLQTVGAVRLALYVALESLVVNVGLNALLIPCCGIRGAAAATFAAQAVSFLHVSAYVFHFEKKIALRPSMLFKTGASDLSGALFGDFVRVALPVTVVSGLWGISTALQTVVLGHMDAQTSGAIAAGAMASSLFAVLKTASNGAASVAAILTGIAVAQGDILVIKKQAWLMQGIFLLIGLVTSALLFCLRAPILSFYNMSAQTKALADRFLLVLCVTGVGTAYQMPTITGIIRGGGDARFCMVNDLVTIWGVVMPLSLLAAFRFGWSPVAVFACLNSDQIIKCAAGAIRCNRFRWVKKLTRPA